MEREAERELVTEYLLISRYSEPPDATSVAQALASAGLGETVYTPAAPRDPTTPPPHRAKVGSYLVRTRNSQTGALQAKITVARYDTPALEGMGDPAFNQLTRRLGSNDIQTLRVGTLALDTRINGPFHAPLDTQRWGLGILRALVSMTEGAVVDPHAQTAWGAETLAAAISASPRAHITVHNEAWGAESRWLHTHGLRKFGRPELDFADVPVALEPEAQALLLEVAENLALGEQLSAGQEITLDDLGTLIALPAAPDLDHQAPWGRLRLCDAPVPPARQSVSPRATLARMALADAERLRANGDDASALDVVERALSADSDDAAALALKAHILLDGDRAHEALEMGELMELRTPGEYRGPLVIGLSLMAIGRYREALHALDRCIEREPEAAEAYSARGEVYARLGDQRLAAVDRARAAYLGG